MKKGCFLCFIFFFFSFFICSSFFLLLFSCKFLVSEVSKLNTQYIIFPQIFTLFFIILSEKQKRKLQKKKKWNTINKNVKKCTALKKCPPERKGICHDFFIFIFSNKICVYVILPVDHFVQISTVFNTFVLHYKWCNKCFKFIYSNRTVC